MTGVMPAGAEKNGAQDARRVRASNRFLLMLFILRS